jgi:hypothetical protein
MINKNEGLYCKVDDDVIIIFVAGYVKNAIQLDGSFHDFIFELKQFDTKVYLEISSSMLFYSSRYKNSVILSFHPCKHCVLTDRISIIFDITRYLRLFRFYSRSVTSDSDSN